MEGIPYLKSYCREKRLKPDEIFQLGHGTKGPYEGRYKVTVDRHKRKESQLYIIQYCKDVGVFIAWDMKTGKPLTGFPSLGQEKVEEYLAGHIHSVLKFIGHVGEDYSQEVVLLFREENIPEFFEKYVFANPNLVLEQ